MMHMSISFGGLMMTMLAISAVSSTIGFIIGLKCK